MSTSTEKEDQKKINELEKFADDLATRVALYGAAADGLSVGIDADIAKIEEYDLDGRMAAAEEKIAGAIADVVTQDATEVTADLEELDADEVEEDKLLAEDEGDPEEEGRKLAQ